MTSPYSLYDEEIATFGEDEVYNQADSAGFIALYACPCCHRRAGHEEAEEVNRNEQPRKGCPAGQLFCASGGRFMKLWQGRLAGDVDERLNRLNPVHRAVDARMYKQDITGSIAPRAHVGQNRACSPVRKRRPSPNGLQGILADLDNGALKIDMTCEDIHTFVEAELTRRIGQPGKKLHTARSRNDQVALDLRLYLADEIEATRARCTAVIEALCNVAEKHLHTVMPGYTHLQRAQPVTLAHHLMAYAQMLLRDRERLAECPRAHAGFPAGFGGAGGHGLSAGPAVCGPAAWHERRERKQPGRRGRPRFRAGTAL